MLLVVDACIKANPSFWADTAQSLKKKVAKVKKPEVKQVEKPKEYFSARAYAIYKEYIDKVVKIK